MIDVRLAPPQRHERLIVFPLVASTECELPYRLLTDVLLSGELNITEVGGGSVPLLHATNKSDFDVLVLDGEQLIGARQNRMTNRSILLPAHSDVEIPVSCMEQGRWRMTAQDMKPSNFHSPSKARRHARDVEAARVHAGGAAGPQELAAAQSSVWSEIRAYSDSLHKHSETGALDELYDALPPIEIVMRAFIRLPDQVGFVAFHDGTPLGTDVIGGRELYARLHERLLTGYVMDSFSMRRAQIGQPAEETHAQRYLDQVRAARRVEAPSVGRGLYQVLVGEVVGGELLDDDRLAHLSAFPAPETRRREDSYDAPPLPPPSRRRRM
jgi:hypothetical protein